VDAGNLLLRSMMKTEYGRNGRLEEVRDVPAQADEMVRLEQDEPSVAWKGKIDEC
jgi:hypothetical protein